MTVEDRILLLTDILVAAIYSDGTMLGEENDAARGLIADLLLIPVDELPANVNERISNFRILRFDLDVAAADFLADPPMQKRRMLELVCKMIDADGETDLREDQFVRDLAESLGMEFSEYEDLVLHIEGIDREELRERKRESFHELVAVGSIPPPIPEDARRR